MKQNTLYNVFEQMYVFMTCVYTTIPAPPFGNVPLLVSLGDILPPAEKKHYATQYVQPTTNFSGRDIYRHNSASTVNIRAE